MVNDFFEWLLNYNKDYYNKCKLIYDSKSSNDEFIQMFTLNKNNSNGTLVDEGLKNVLISDIKKHGHFVETGTNLGYLVKELSKYSNLTESCEFSIWEHCMALYNNKDSKNLKLYYLDSEEFLKNINLSDDSVLFLDAHGGGYDNWNSNPLTKELDIIIQKQIQPIIYIHDFAIESDDSNDIKFTHESFDKSYKYKFDYDVESGWKLDWNFISDQIEKIYKGGYITSYPYDYPSKWQENGWIRIEKK